MVKALYVEKKPEFANRAKELIKKANADRKSVV